MASNYRKSYITDTCGIYLFQIDPKSPSALGMSHDGSASIRTWVPREFCYRTMVGNQPLILGESLRNLGGLLKS